MTDFEWSRPGMTVRTGVELQAARKAAAERFMAVVMMYVPEGYTIKYRKSLSGPHRDVSKVIEAPRPVTRKALYIFLHECADTHLGHSHDGKAPRHLEEMQAVGTREDAGERNRRSPRHGHPEGIYLREFRRLVSWSQTACIRSIPYPV